MEDNNNQLLENMYNATVKCITISKNFTDKNELKSNKLLFDNLISNLVVIYESESKLDKHIKNVYPFIDWSKIDKYKQLIKSDYHELDINIIWEILLEQLPVLNEKLEKILA